MKNSVKALSVLLIAIIAFSLILSGCAGSKTQQENTTVKLTEQKNTTQETTREAKKVEFRIVGWAADGRKEILNKIFEQYKAIKPNVSITYEEVAQNPVDFDTWMAAQLAGNQAPEVGINFTGDEPYKKYVDKGFKVLEMSPYLDKISPYTDKKWREGFREVDLDTMRSTQDGNLYNISVATVTVKIAYNKDIYDKLGLNVPKTYPEMIENFKKIRESKISEPFAGFLKITPCWDWFARQVAQQTQEHLVPQIDTFIKNKKYEADEYIKALDDGIFDVNKPEVRNIYELFKEFSSYFAPGAISMGPAEATDMWLQGKAAHVFSTSGDAKIFATDKKPPFNWDTFEFPVITKDIAPTSNENPAEFGDLTESYIVMPSAIDKNIQDDIIDYLMFYTSPKTAAFIADEAWTIPIIVGVEPNENLKRFLPVNRPQKMIELNCQFRISVACRQYVHQQLQRLVLNDITTDEFIKLIDKNIKDETAKTKAEKGWSKENNYGFVQK